MRHYILFLRALLGNLNQIRDLLGRQWPKLQVQVHGLLLELIMEGNKQTFAVRVNRIYRAFKGTSAEALAHEFFQKSKEQAEQLEKENITQSTRITVATPSDTHSELRSTTRGKVKLEDAVFLRGKPKSANAGVSSRGRLKSGTTGVSSWQKLKSNTPVASSRRNLGLDATASTEQLITVAQELLQIINPRVEEAMVDEEPGSNSTTPPRISVTSYPHLQGEDHAYLNKPYHLTVKLSDQPQPRGAHLSTQKMEIPVEVGEIVKKIQVKLTAPDFDLDPAEMTQGWLREINFYPGAASSDPVIFILLPQDRFEERFFSTLQVQFLMNGQVLGHAARRVEVLQSNTVIKTPINAFPPVRGYPLDERGEIRVQPIPTPIFTSSTVSDVHLTITISEADPPARLLWQIASPYLHTTDFPVGDYFSQNLGTEEFVREYLAPFGMPGNWREDHMTNDGWLKPSSIPILYSNLLKLRDIAPPQFWTLYELALERHCAGGKTPEEFAILFITADTHVPWELMPVSKQVSNGNMPALLGSAHCVGRWLLETGVTVPEAALNLEGFMLAVPSYETQPLPQAQEEKMFLKNRYHPRELADDPNDFLAFMKTGGDTYGTGILHFAGHGDCCTDKLRSNWLVLTNRNAFYDVNSASTDLGNRLGKLRPILAFFNACNVGRAASGPLGSNGGWGRALLNQEYKGYIGPLWSVYDQHARDVCQMFYTLALDEHLPLGEVIRRIRARFSKDNRLFTYLAYLYLGHPLAKITYTPFTK